MVAKYYGGDILCEHELVYKQKEGKEMRRFGRVKIPQEAFIAVSKRDD